MHVVGTFCSVLRISCVCLCSCAGKEDRGVSSDGFGRSLQERVPPLTVPCVVPETARHAVGLRLNSRACFRIIIKA